MRFFARFSGLRSERGGVLIEVMVSAMLVALVATAVFKSIDGASATSGAGKARAAATTLAQQDQDRLRALDPTRLSNYHPAAAITTVDGVQYTVASDATYVSDGSATESCSSSSTDKNADYLRITSTVTWPNMGNKKPVKATSIVTPRNGVFEGRGSLVVKVINRDGLAQSGVPVSITSPDAVTITTNSAGCAFFGNLQPGAKTGGFGLAGYVDPAGTQSITGNWTVTANQTVFYTYQYDQAATVNVSFDTKIGSASPSTATSDGVTFVNGGIPAPPYTGKRIFNITPVASTATIGGLFPFASGYTVYSGKCATAANAAPPAYTIPVATNPGATSSVTVRKPALNVKVTKDTTNGAVHPGTRLMVKPSSDSTCGTQYVTIDSTGAITPAQNGFPYGSYTVCADDMPLVNNVTGNARKSSNTTLTLTDDLGGPTTASVFPVATSGNKNGPCT